ncbi:hypothetical protein CVT25_004153 [Psilocybe cyanescens]|uniref:Uncharacterized protein n=1 Tax=Psilocybe cyanescens TaxID=93625 RepID=A0A409XL07_PSICY|nr:hypothetical protein CVT25_004153 [Psilocybe cyanescens]
MIDSDDVEKRIISANLNGSGLQIFLMAVYTVVYGTTMYLYLSKTSANSNRRIVLSAISVLYLLVFLQTLAQWYSLYWIVVTNGKTQQSIFLATLEQPRWIEVLSDFGINSSFIVADGLLIWRCYYVWGQSFWTIVVPSILLIAEFGLFVAVIAIDGLYSQLTSHADAVIFNKVRSSLVFISIGTTVSTTFLIGWRVHSVSRLNGLPSKKMFSHIMVLIVESAAAYSFALLFDAIVNVVPTDCLVNSPVLEARCYVPATLCTVTGMAPTVLVARIALTNPKHTVASSPITHISSLQFELQQGTGRSVNATNSLIHTFHEAPTAANEVKSRSSWDSTFGNNQV